jgi:hypothetical protein
MAAAAPENYLQFQFRQVYSSFISYLTQLPILFISSLCFNSADPEFDSQFRHQATLFSVLFSDPAPLLGLGPEPTGAARRPRATDTIRRLRSGPVSARAVFFLLFYVL